jgi:hypothetical protein
LYTAIQRKEPQIDEELYLELYGRRPPKHHAPKARPHAHTWIPDGVFIEQDDGDLSFVPLAPPSDEDIEPPCQGIAKRIAKLCAGDGEDLLVDDEDAVMASVKAEGACVAWSTG